jgi:hypothetical protein
MATTWKTITVRVERPPDTPLGEFFGDMRTWLDHHCIILADFRGVTLASKSGVFDALFDNPRDALNFGRRFAHQPTSGVPARIASRRSIIETTSSIAHGRRSVPAAIAGVMRSVVWMRTKLYQTAYRAAM